LQVSNSNVFKVGQWVRLWNFNPGNRRRLQRRSLLSSEAGLAAAHAVERHEAATGRHLAHTEASAHSLPYRMFEDPQLQAAAAAAAAAEEAAMKAALASGPEPDRAEAYATDPEAAALAAEKQSAALNPLGMDPMLLATARYASDALAAEIVDGEFDPDTLEGGEGGKAPALAVPGSLDYYLYGDNRAVDSGANNSKL
jgi:hypothetical protein